MTRLNLRLPLPNGTASRAEQMFYTGYGFHEAALRCAEEVPTGENEICSPTAPFIANLALAAELYLKAAIEASGRSAPRGHRLNVLWQLLTPQAQASVRARMALLSDATGPAFLAELQQLGAAFVEWRYIFEAEGRNISVSILAEFTRGLYRHLRAVHSNWRFSPYIDGRIERDGRRYPLHVVCAGGGVVGTVIGGS